MKCLFCTDFVLKVITRRPNNGVRASLSEMGEYFSQRPPTPLLDSINYPVHMKNLSNKVNINSNHMFLVVA